MHRSIQPSPYLSTVRTRSGAVVPYIYGRPSSQSPPWTISTASSQMTDYSSAGGPPDSDWDRATPPPGSLPVPAPSSPSSSTADSSFHSLFEARFGSPSPTPDLSDIQPEHYWSFSPPASPMLSSIPPPVQAAATPDILRSCCAINHPVHESQLTNQIHPLFQAPCFQFPSYVSSQGLTSPQAPATPLLPATQSLTACSPFNTLSTPTTAALDPMATLTTRTPFDLPDAAVATSPPNIDLTLTSQDPVPSPPPAHQPSPPASSSPSLPDLPALLQTTLHPALQLASHLLHAPPTLNFLARVLHSPYATAAIPVSAPEANGLLYWHFSPVESAHPSLLTSVHDMIDAALPHLRILFVEPSEMSGLTTFGEMTADAPPDITIRLTSRFVTEAFGCPEYVDSWSEASKLRASLFFAANLVHEVVHALHHWHRGSVQPRPEGWPQAGREPFFSEERWERLFDRGHGEGSGWRREVEGELGLAWGVEVLGVDLEPVGGVGGLDGTQGLVGRKRRWVADGEEEDNGGLAEAIAAELRRGESETDGANEQGRRDGTLEQERKRRKVRQETCWGGVPMGWVEGLFEDETWEGIQRGGRWREEMEMGRAEGEARGGWAIDGAEVLKVPLGGERFWVD